MSCLLKDVSLQESFQASFWSLNLELQLALKKEITE